jgi:hypothetical protein
MTLTIQLLIQAQLLHRPTDSQGFGGAPILESLPTSLDDIQEIMLPHICTAHVYSRALGRLKPTRYLHDSQKIIWKDNLVTFYQHIHNKTEQWKISKDPLLLANTVLEFVHFPTCVLLDNTNLSKIHHTTKVCVDGVTQTWDIPAAQEREAVPAADPMPPQHDVNSIPTCTTTKRAIKLYKVGRRKASKQTLHSFGVGPRNEATRDALRDLTIPRSEILPKEPFAADVPFVEGQVAKNVTNKAMAIGGIDVFGFATDMLSLVVNVPATSTCPKPTVVHEEFIKMLSCTSVVPDCVAYLLAAGSLTPLNKEPAEVNAELVASGEKSHYRPINTGSMPMANLGSNMLKSTHGKEANKKVLPIQKGFTRNGCDKTIHTMRGAYNHGKAILSLDGIGAFANITRKAIIEGAKILWPEASPFLEQFYNLPMPVLYLYTVIRMVLFGLT